MWSLLIGATAMSLLALPTFVSAQEGAAAGAVTGAVTGGIVGGPVGAAVGAGVGGLAGSAAEADARRRDGVVVVDPGPGRGGCEATTVRRENALGESRTVTTERC